MEIPDEMIEEMIPAVKEQLNSSQTVYVKDCYDRLITQEKKSDQEAVELIAQVLAAVANEMMLSGKAFDTGLYRKLLKALPSLPDESL